MPKVKVKTVFCAVIKSFCIKIKFQTSVSSAVLNSSQLNLDNASTANG